MRALGVAKLERGAASAEQLPAPSTAAAKRNVSALMEASDEAPAAVDEWVLVGLLPLFDPPRDDSAKVIQLLHDLGVSVKMLTGDQVAIAIDTSQRLGLGTNVLNCSVLDPAKSVPPATAESLQHMQTNRSVWTIQQGGDGVREVTQEHKTQAQSNIRKEEQKGEEDEALVVKVENKKEDESSKKELPLPYDEDLMRLVESTDGFGEVMPQHKHQVVRILQHLGHIVGMTGGQPQHNTRAPNALHSLVVLRHSLAACETLHCVFRWCQR